MDYKHRLAAVVLAGALCLEADPARADPEVGWWWNPAESGRGFFIENKDGIIFLGGYFYENDGRAKWLVSGGPIANPYSYDGRLLSVSGGQTLFGPYVPPTPAVDVGPVSLRFADDTHATLTWPGGTIPIEREVFATQKAPFQPVNGWWWNAGESGRGFSVEVRGGSAFVVAFMYDLAGQPVWYFTAGPMSSPTIYEGSWLQFANGQTMGGSYHPPGAPVTVGQVSLQFTSDDEMTASWTDDPPSAAGMRSTKVRTVIITVPQFPKKYTPPQLAVPHPAHLDGEFTQTQDIKGTLMASSGVNGTVHSTLVYTGNLTWTIPEGTLPPADGSADYVLPTMVGNLPVNNKLLMNYTFHSKGEGETCDGSLVDVPIDVVFEPSSRLHVDKFGAYDGTIRSLALPAVPLKVTCVNPSRMPPTSTEDDVAGLAQVIAITVTGKNQVYAINCTKPVQVINAGDAVYTFTRQCSFAGAQP